MLPAPAAASWPWFVLAAAASLPLMGLTGLAAAVVDEDEEGCAAPSESCFSSSLICHCVMQCGDEAKQHSF
jgi:hypothetical protein